MALFINNVSSAKIVILGCWFSDAFLVCIHPQVLEWTNNMSKEMVAADSFFDVQKYHHTIPGDLAYEPTNTTPPSMAHQSSFLDYN